MTVTLGLLLEIVINVLPTTTTIPIALFALGPQLATAVAIVPHREPVDVMPIILELLALNFALVPPLVVIVAIVIQ